MLDSQPFERGEVINQIGTKAHFVVVGYSQDKALIRIVNYSPDTGPVVPEHTRVLVLKTTTLPHFYTLAGNALQTNTGISEEAPV